MATEKSASSRKSTPSKETAARKKQSASGASSRTSASNGATKRTSTRASAPRAEAPRRTSASKVAGLAAHQLLELTGKEAEGVTGLERTEDGWRVLVDVVELRRVPSTTDVLATYEVEVDTHGDLEGYRRLRRFVRGTAGGDGS